MNLRSITTAALLAGLGITHAASAAEADWYPSRYGANDTLGAINNLSPEKVVEAAKLVTDGKTYRLGVPTGPDSPAYPPRQYSLTVLQPGDGTGATLGANRATGNDDLLYTWMGIGSQIDGLGHMGIEHTYYNGNEASEFVTARGLTKLSIDKLPPIVSRGVLIDVAGHLDQDVVEAGTVITRKMIDTITAEHDIEIGSGDVVLFHTGWLNVADSDTERFMAGEPGIGMEVAEYLAGLGVVAIGSDTWAVEVLPHEDPEQAFPVHATLLAKHGVYILENMDTRELAADGVAEFLFVLGQPRFVGAVQAVINPVAIR